MPLLDEPEIVNGKRKRTPPCRLNLSSLKGKPPKEKQSRKVRKQKVVSTVAPPTEPDVREVSAAKQRCASLEKEIERLKKEQAQANALHSVQQEHRDLEEANKKLKWLVVSLREVAKSHARDEGRMLIQMDNLLSAFDVN